MSFIKIEPGSQLNDKTLDGQPDENKWFDCVPECIDVAVQALTGKSMGADWWKDQAYGQGYQGGTAARQYIPTAEKQGVSLFPIDGSKAQLIAAVHEQLAQGHPVIATEPDPYAPGHPDWSHVVLFYEDVPGQLSAMDPMYGQTVTRKDSEWAALFEFNEVWALERMNEVAVPTGWSLSKDKKTLTAPNGVIMVMGFMGQVLNDPKWDAKNVPLEKEHGSAAGGTEQLCMNVLLTWNPKDGVQEHQLGGIVLDREAQITALHAQIDTLQAQLKVAEAGIPAVVQGALTSVLHSTADLQAAIQGALSAAPPPAVVQPGK